MQGKGVSNHLSAELQSSDPPSAGSLLQHLSKICEEYTGNKTIEDGCSTVNYITCLEIGSLNRKEQLMTLG